MQPNLELEITKLNQSTLPSDALHHFSYLIYREQDEVKQYFELSQTFHRKFRSRWFFRWRWQTSIRSGYTVESALFWRAHAVMRRAGIVPMDLKYMTTAIFPSKQAGKMRMRHVIGMKITDADFGRLTSEGLLRLCYTDRGNDTDRRSMLFGLAPLRLRAPERAVA